MPLFIQGRGAPGRALGRSVLLAGTAGLLCLALACRGRRPVSEGQAAIEAPVTLETRPVSPGFEVLRSESTPTSMVLHLRWHGPPPGGAETRSLGFCLPETLQVRATWLEARLDGQPLRIGPINSHRTSAPAGGEPSPELSPFAGGIQFLGYLRHWPIHRLMLARDVFEPLRRRGPPGAATQSSYDLTLQLSWNEPLPKDKPPAIAEAGAQSRAAWHRVAESLVLNPDGLDRFARADPPWPTGLPRETTDPRRLAPGERVWARLSAEGEGLVRLDPLELERVGFPVDRLKPEAVRVFSHGATVPLLIAPGEGVPDGVPPGIYLWVHGGQGPYTRERVYWVTLAPDAPAARLKPATDAPDPAAARPRATVPRVWTRDKDLVFRARHGRFMAFLGMRWVEAPLERNRPLLLPVTLPWLAPDAGDPRLTLRFFVDRERSLQGARVDLGADFQTRESLRFTGVDDTTRQVALPSGAFHDGATTLSLLLVDGSPPAPSAESDETETGSGVWFDRLEAVYPSLPRLIEGRLTIPVEAAGGGAVWIALPDLDPTTHPTVLALRIGRDNEARTLWPIRRDAQGRTGVVMSASQGCRLELVDPTRLAESPRLERVEPEDLIDPKEPCDLLIVTHDAFRKAAEQLADHRRSQGWAVRVVDVQSVYNQFSDGECSPVAIRALLAHALRRWPAGAPAQVLLVGDTTADYLGEARNGVRNWIPTYTYSDGGDSFASDYWFTTVAGNDRLGDYLLGRLSVASREDAQTVVEKIIAYDRQPRPGPWRARLGYIADQGEFPTVLDELRREATPRAYGAERVFLNEYPLEDNWYLALQLVQSKEMKISRQATEDILRLFRKGVSFLCYYGHGSPNIWSNERMWFGGGSVNSDNRMLEGSGVACFVANMTCNSGAIDYPLTPWNICITEDLMRVRDGGAIGCFVPSGPSVTLIHQRLSEALQEMLYRRGLRRLGEVTTAAKVRYLLDGNPDEVAFMYLLLGDPLTELQLTSRRGDFRLDPGVAAPGRALRLTLTGVTPAPGQWSAELATDDNARLWVGEGTVGRDRRATLRIDVPTTAPAGQAVLRVYCWPGPNGPADQDLALAGDLRIETPYVALGPVTLQPMAGGRIRAEAEVTNPTRLPGTGRLTVWVEDAAGSHTLLDETVAGAGRRAVSIAPEGRTRTESYLAVRLQSVNAPDETALPRTTFRRLALWPPQGREAALLAPLCVLEEGPRVHHGELSVTAAVASELAARLVRDGGQLVAGVDAAGGETLAMATLTLEPFLGGVPAGEGHDPQNAKLAAGKLKLEDARQEKLAGAQLWLALQAKGATGGRGPRLDSLPLDRVERRRPDLEIAPDSIVPRPASPTEGETVFIDCTVANRGNLSALATTLRLLDSPPWEGAHPAEVRMRSGTVRVPVLAPGRAERLTLRWDPVHNAGAHKLWLQLMNETGYAPRPDPRQVRELTVVARTKPDLAVGRTWTDASERDQRYHRVNIRAEVVNRGQSAAHKVMVAFYRSHVQVEETKLGEVLLETVPAENAAVASYTWTYDPARDVVRGGQLPQPTIKVWLKGSVRPPISTGETPADK
jgi:hypothetical protein